MIYEAALKTGRLNPVRELVLTMIENNDRFKKNIFNLYLVYVQISMFLIASGQFSLAMALT